MHHDIYLFMHHIDFFLYFFVLTCSLSFVFFFFLLFLVMFLCLCPYPSTMPRKTRAHRTPSTSSKSPFRSELFQSDNSRELYEKLNSKWKIWAEQKVVLDELDPTIRANFESRGWLPLLGIDHLPPTTTIREFYSNLSCNIYDANTLVRSWIRDVEFTITPRVVAEALGVSVVRQPVYPYAESPPLDDIMSYITGSSI